MKKNFNKIPNNVLNKINSMECRYFKVGIKLKIKKADIEKYRHLGIKVVDGNLICGSSILPSKMNGRYSKYNCEGRQIRRKDLPKIDKIFFGECYPYGNTNSSKVPYSYTKKVWQVEEWIPQYLKINISVNTEFDGFSAFFEVNTILDKQRQDFEEEVLFAINLMQENIGKYEIYPADAEPSEIAKWEYVNWEFLPPGKIDEELVKKYFGKKSNQEQKEILERYNFMQSLSPICMISGTNYFSKYFGAKFENEVVVLENTESGNAIYVFHQDWEELSKLSRSDLRKISSAKVTRIVHLGDWKKKLEYEIHKI